MSNIIASIDENIKIAANILRSDELVAFPTETVYGLGGNAYSDKVVAKIFACKNRPVFNPLSVCYRNIEHASEDLVITKTAEILAEKFLPGAITIILRKKSESKLSLLCSAGMDTIGLRIPSNRIALRLLSLVPFPLAAPSANKSGEFSPTTAQAVYDSLLCDSLTILDGGNCEFGIETTIVECSAEMPSILRIGAVSKSEIEDKCKIKLEIKEKVNYYSCDNNFLCKKLIMNATTANEDDAVLAIGKVFENNCKYVLNLSPDENLNEAAANFFSMLHELNQADVNRICVMPIPNVGIGVAINDRLKRYSKV